MSKHKAPLTAVELARKMATKAPEGKRLGGPGTRSKNPLLYDRIGAEIKAARNVQ